MVLLLWLLLLLVRLPMLRLLLLLLVRRLLLPLLLSTSVVVFPVLSPTVSPTFLAMLNTLIALSQIDSNEGVSRPVPQLLLPRHLHLSVSAEHHIFKDLVCKLCVGKHNPLLHSESR